MEIHQLRVDMVVDAPLLQVKFFPVVAQRLIPMVSLNMEIPQFFIDKVVVAPVVLVERLPVPCVVRFMRHEARS